MLAQSLSILNSFNFIFSQKLKEDRLKALRHYNKNQSPIVDTTITDYTKLLSPHTYEKASWVLHMLRKKIGDVDFYQGLQNYLSNPVEHLSLRRFEDYHL